MRKSHLSDNIIQWLLFIQTYFNIFWDLIHGSDCIICFMLYLGLTVNISEMDCRISKLPERCVDHSKEGDMGGMDLRTFAQKQIYKDVLSAVLEEPAFDGIWFWGFTDKHTWVKNFYYDDEPLLWDVEYKRKQAYFGIREALETFAGGTANNNKKEWSEDWGSIWRQAEPESVIKEQEQVNSSENDKPDWELESEQ